MLLALTALAGSCDPQADSDYLGEPLITLPGYVKSAGPAPLEAAMLWQRGAPPSTDDQELATRARVRTEFPNSFVLHLYQPPPAAARRKLAAGEVTYARANAGAVPYGIASGAVGALPGPPGSPTAAAYGIDPGHWVVYLASDVPPGSLTEWWLGAALPAGFHLLRVSAFNPRCAPAAQVDACVAGLVQRGVPDDGTSNEGMARSFCLAPYRLSLAPPGEQLVLELGTVGVGAGGGCP
ncbi:MAG TPA: hypothetical protein VE755_02950 [Myxococcales bacterium]|nr:hypothetical protein [Myxococcales bacterium]